MHSRVISLFVALGLAGCATPVVLDAYTGPTEPDSALAIVRCWSSCMASVKNLDDPSVYYDLRGSEHVAVVRLKPGTYEFESWAAGVRPYAGYVTDRISLVAGHRYAVRGTNCDDDMYYVWYEDETAGEIVSGYRPRPLWICGLLY